MKLHSYTEACSDGITFQLRHVASDEEWLSLPQAPHNNNHVSTESNVELVHQNRYCAEKRIEGCNLYSYTHRCLSGTGATPNNYHTVGTIVLKA